MTIESWEPDSQNINYSLDLSFLKQLALCCSKTDETNITSCINPKQQQQHSPIMQLPKESWHEIGPQLTTAEIIQLIKFFTLAEEHINGWDGGAKSPVIWLTKILKQQGQTMDKELLRWIKTNSRNKFLPHGAL